MGQQPNELSEYVNMKIAKDVDMVVFWKENRALLPQLFKVARRVLCVPASSSASEGFELESFYAHVSLHGTYRRTDRLDTKANGQDP